MVVVLGLAFVLSATVTIISLFRSGVTYVPNVIGRSETEAQKMIDEAGLEVKVQHRSDPAPANTVIDMNRPPNSSVKKGFTITIVVSSGPAQTKSELRVPGPEGWVPGSEFRVPSSEFRFSVDSGITLAEVQATSRRLEIWNSEPGTLNPEL